MTDKENPIKIRRTKDNKRYRTNAQNRHDPPSNENLLDESFHFVNPTNLEWLSLNYRKERAAKMSPSKRRMILIMFQNDTSYFPSIREIRDELIQA